MKKIEIIGPIGSYCSAFVCLACLGFAPIWSLLSFLGLSQIVNDAILNPLLAFFLIVGIVGLYFSYKQHNKILPLIIGTASSFLAWFFLYGFYRNYLLPLVYIGFIGILVSSIFNYLAKKRKWIFR